ncbi:hypothetical protein M2139_000228 [Enterococcus sp. PF1-24]|uniref:glycoside hydrolase family 9 protein n=1 Tax=unclassified Enterococcus TaxID=2608891 RepID=UPI002475C1E2|nr:MULTISPECIES: glycoside hydrolase family 9 protein [unclassified Enterococcus]MDH6363352.1 hypothetical protein [Enterococcus sp. PFB1-1]MDH6400347.1 hypothetical protein [Enterococcus sp. PF1-24]
MIEELTASNFLHQPLKVSFENGFEARMLKNEKILASKKLTGTWQHQGRGTLQKNADAIILTSPARYDSYPEGWPQDGDYTSFGEIAALLTFDPQDWQDFTQIKLEVACDCENIINPAITLGVFNDGAIKIPDIYNREGSHIINLTNKKSETYVLDISNLPRDVVTKLRISFNANGSYMNLPGNWQITIKQIVLEKNAEATSAKGWQVDKNNLSYAHIGYPLNGKKQVIADATWAGETFQLKKVASAEVVFVGEMTNFESSIGHFSCADFSDFQVAGEYYVELASLKTAGFKIGDYQTLLQDSIWKSLNFVYCERCGCPIKGIHGTCHQDVFGEFAGKKISFNGGWHDAGDLSQQLVQTAEVTLSLFEMAKHYRPKDTALALRLAEEAEWGLDFIFKTRLGDGNRLTSAGSSRWTDNQLGNMDDIKARIHNSPYDNFLITGTLAKILITLPSDSDLIEKIQSILEVDFNDAYAGFEKQPFIHEPIFWEHTYSTSKSTYLATLVWTSALLYQITKKADYLEKMQAWLKDLLACQEKQGIELFDGQVLRGMFYRDEQQQVFQHFNHQAREHLFAYALAEAKKVVKDAALANQLTEAITIYGEYLEFLVVDTAPYPMIASGIYHQDEWQDEASFNKQHLLVSEEAYESYQKQLLQGKQIAEKYYIKRFPVWFSFRGNNGILLSMGESAAIIGQLLNNQKLLNIGFGQMQWMIGQNPFSQSMMYGEGQNYPQMYTVSSGEMVGEMPVGIQTFENEDQPYWPQFNNATYKEVWVGLAGKWFSLAEKLFD